MANLIILASEFSRDMMVEGRPDKKVKEQELVAALLEEIEKM